jgi:hypothetical protein
MWCFHRMTLCQVVEVKYRLEEKIRARLAKEEQVLERIKAALEHAKHVAEQKESRLTSIRAASRNSIASNASRRNSITRSVTDASPVPMIAAGPSAPAYVTSLTRTTLFWHLLQPLLCSDCRR